MNAAEIENDLRNYYGTEKWTIHWSKKILMTDGVLAMRELCNAFWLTDIIASVQTKKLMQECDGFQVWIFKRDGSKGVIECYRDTGPGNKPKYQQEIEFTDFPLEEIMFYVAETGEGHPPTMMLTSEY